MKKSTRMRLVGGLILVGSILVMSGVAMAFPYIEVEGFVDSRNATQTNLGDGLIQFEGLEYSFHVTGSMNGAQMDYLSLEFENDVFKEITTGPYNYNPDDWKSSSISSSSSIYFVSRADSNTQPGTPVGFGSGLSFLVDAIIFESALSDASQWDEGQIWSQSWIASDTRGGGDGGSTAHATPEPVTMLLVGTGLVGLAGVRGKRLLKK